MKPRAKCNSCSEEEFNPTSNDFMNALKRRSNESKVMTVSVLVSFPDLSIIEGRFEIASGYISEADPNEIKQNFSRYIQEVCSDILEYDRFNEYLLKQKEYRWIK